MFRFESGLMVGWLIKQYTLYCWNTFFKASQESIRLVRLFTSPNVAMHVQLLPDMLRLTNISHFMLQSPALFYYISKPCKLSNMENLSAHHVINMFLWRKAFKNSQTFLLFQFSKSLFCPTHLKWFMYVIIYLLNEFRENWNCPIRQKQCSDQLKFD